MRTRGGLVLVGLLLGLWPAGASAEQGRAVIENRRGAAPMLLGIASLTDTQEGLQVRVDVMGVPPGKHGLHIHEYGDCSDGGDAAGGHLNPDGAPHGFLPSDGLVGAHPGDMGNIEIGLDGSGTLTVLLPQVTLSGGSYSVAGRAIVLHQGPDDFSQPTGNAGSRFGCGVIMLTAPPAAEEPAL